MTNTTTPTRATAFAGVVVFGVQKTISMSRRYDNDWKKSPPIRCDLVNKLGYLPFCMTNNLANCAVGIGAATASAIPPAHFLKGEFGFENRLY